MRRGAGPSAECPVSDDELAKRIAWLVQRDEESQTASAERDLELEKLKADFPLWTMGLIAGGPESSPATELVSSAPRCCARTARASASWRAVPIAAKTNPDQQAQYVFATAPGQRTYQPREVDDGASVFGRALLDGLAAIQPGVELACGGAVCNVHLYPLHAYLKARSPRSSSTTAAPTLHASGGAACSIAWR